MEKSCLIVEDNEISGFVYSEHIRTMGFSCTHLTDGAIALAYCAESMPDVILLDWHMPNVDGEEFLVQLRAMSGGARPVVIVSTCDDRADGDPEFLKHDVKGFLVKPTYHDHLYKKFKELGLLTKDVISA